MFLETLTITPLAAGLPAPSDWLWRPMVPPLHLVGVAAVLVGLAIWAYARTLRDRPWSSAALLAMRLIVVAALVGLVMGPSVPAPAPAGRSRPRLDILVDTSESMATRDLGTATRLGAAQGAWLTDEMLGKLDAVCDVSFFAFDRSIRPVASEALSAPVEALATGRRTELAACISQRVAQSRARASDVALLVLSDGHDTDDHPLQPIALRAKARGIPIHTCCFGGPTRQKDLVLTARPAQRCLLTKARGAIRVRLDQVGLGEVIAARQKAGNPLRVHAQCEQDETTITRPVRFARQRSTTVELPVRHEAGGEYAYRVWVDSLDEEIEDGNNAQHVFIEAVEQHIAVLLLEGEPFWETKFIARALRKDARVQVTQISQVAAEKTVVIIGGEQPAADASPYPPKTLNDLAGYDVVILGRGLERLLSAALLEQLPQYVADRGGNIVFARGRPYDPTTASGRQTARELAVIEPVVWGQGLRHHLALASTAAGRRTFLGQLTDTGDARALPGFDVMPAVARVKTGTMVLARGVAPSRAASDPEQSDPPALVRMPYGRGRIVSILGEGLWQWGLQSVAGGAEGAAPYETFWSALVGWLVMGSDFRPGHDVALLPGRTSVRAEQDLLVQAVCKTVPEGGFRPTVRWRRPDGSEQTLALAEADGRADRHQGTLTTTQAGVHTLVLDAPQCTPSRIRRRFSVYDVSVERLHAAANPEALRRLATDSGGQVFLPNQADRFAAELGGLFSREHLRSGPRYIWDRWAVLVVLLVWAGAEWILRKKAGLL
ncbi:MAG: hypothetical protein KGY99_10740 [Phycisphaerae bacterium]|nr:hypothetical protein [Phycisphaerae bacterium]